MPSINKIILLGHIGQEPKTYTTSTGKIYTKFSIATQDNQAGQTAETAWHSCTAWGEVAAKILSNCAKGDLIYIEGKMVYGKYKEQKTFQVFTNQVIPLRHAYRKGSSVNEEQNQEKNYAESARETAEKLAAELGGEVMEDKTDEIPF